EAFLREELGDFKYDLAPGAFFQTNIGVAELLQKMLVELIGKCLENEADASSSVLSGGAAESAAQPEAWDLYSGVGALTFPLAPLFGKVAGFELSSAAVQSAKRNAGLNGFSNCRFEAGDVRKLVRRFSGAPKLVVLDPPRAGLAGELVKTLLLKKVPWLIYVSCNPHTLARDLGLLSEKYELKRVQGLDMFPHTHHLETLVLLKRRSG
ncbi:MAG: class I SAM-dependent RNA methyltransferase, partial [Desulfovibrionaceae bacterium]|nr:class I SAM-dependent RNA methyltransferase [Desulfovibrionaceae bacterium]